MNHQLIRDEGHRNRMSVEQLESRMKMFLIGDYQAVIFFKESQNLGYALFRRDPDGVYLRQFWIDADFRRQGLGRTALSLLQTQVWKDRPRVRLDVLADNPTGISFWRSVGFVDYSITMELDPKA